MKTVKQCKNCAWRKNRAEKTPFAKEIPGLSMFRCCRTFCMVSLDDTCVYWIGYYGNPVQLDAFLYVNSSKEREGKR